MNTALLMHLLAQAQQVVHGHHFGGWTSFQCFEWVKVVHAGSGEVGRRLVCGTIHVWEHGIVMKWR